MMRILWSIKPIRISIMVGIILIGLVLIDAQQKYVRESKVVTVDIHPTGQYIEKDVSGMPEEEINNLMNGGNAD